MNIKTLTVAIIAAVSFNASALTLRLADTMPEGVPNALGVAYFSKKVEEYSNGDIKVKVFSNGMLGSERENVEQLKQGVVDMARIGAATLDSFTEAVKPVTLPYIFSDTDHLIRAMDGDAGQTLYNHMAKDGIHALNYFVIGSRSFYTKNKAITTPEDLKGLKIRVMPSQMAIKTMELLGASPTPLPQGDVYAALQQGVIDGAENAPQALIEHGHGNVAKFFSFDEHFNYPEFILISENAMKRLSPEEMGIIKKAAKEATVYEVDLAKAAVQHAIDTAKNITFNKVDKTLFQAKVQPLYDQLIAEDISTKKIIDQINAVR
ncbi:TRAP transporter substrate-binding protein [Vibrio aestuarianus]|uniref:TRAP transporter substrate-binding protein n=1 Tax=Vibrio aestuarianus TaxID=28171 RepID=A0ABD7YIY1_9VIBR|nr:TRAP transporter substrate-binding protein [Vibrio aestuarianus]MDE1230367.1 TRAP transporter substrate-binding protein [Vibrio aestuarianus]MDE1327892.1 TRAP transporter substrate-binding protein [Vibrio aestuarianus]WGK84774.1 TRAP transporter substrate-binding protein [Vibrio aestuarianus]CAH8215223.1 TRAP dicarboxylate transporter, DctP subunit [Vibrio aestuarianus]